MTGFVAQDDGFLHLQPGIFGAGIISAGDSDIAGGTVSHITFWLTLVAVMMN